MSFLHLHTILNWRVLYSNKIITWRTVQNALLDGLEYNESRYIPFISDQPGSWYSGQCPTLRANRLGN